MQNIINAAPLANLLGIEDVSGRPPVIDPEVLPTHLPHVYLYAEKGPTLPQLVAGDSFDTIYGAKTLDPRFAGFNHQSVLANRLLGAGNAMIVQRIVPSNAGPKARILLSIDIVTDQIQQYEREADGSFSRDANGAKIPIEDGLKNGYKARWIANDWAAGQQTDEAFGVVTNKAGGLSGQFGPQSTMYPIFEIEYNWKGEPGNHHGVRFSAPTADSPGPLNTSLAELLKAYLYRIQLVQRADASSSPVTIKTLQGEEFLNLTFKPGAIDDVTGQEVSFAASLLKSYQDVDSPGLPPTYGPFGRLHIYEANLKLVLSMIAQSEAPEGLLPEDQMDITSEALYAVNPFTGTNFEGVPYYTFNLIGPEGGGLLLTDNTVVYGAGGSNGTMDFDAFDTSVRTELLNYGNGEADLTDWAIYPQSVIYDTGFKLDTKKAMLVPMSRRKDLYVVLSTQDVSQPQNTPSAESSIALALKTAAANYPESVFYGTSVCRVIVMGNSGYLLNSPYTGLLPVTIEFAERCAQYMSSGTGQWRSGLGFDMPPNNQLSLFRGVNATFKSASSRNRDWDNGLVWVQNYDRRRQFWPMIQTVYDDDSSVLNSAMNMIVAVDLEKVALHAWRDTTGIQGLTNDQIVERVNRLIEAETRGRYEGRVVVVPETYYTFMDEQRGYSWTTKIHMYAPNGKSVGTFTVTAHRLSDLPQGA